MPEGIQQLGKYRILKESSRGGFATRGIEVGPFAPRAALAPLLARWTNRSGRAGRN